MKSKLTNWRNWEYNQAGPTTVCTANTIDEIREVMEKAKIQGKTIRVGNGGRKGKYSGSFSGSSVVKNDHQIILVTPGLCHGYVHDDGSNRVTAEGGMTLGELTTLIQSHNLSFETMPVPTFITVAGAIGTSSHGCGNMGGTFSDLVVGMEIMLHDGTIKKITEDDPELLNAAKVHLGSLGVVITVTFQCEPAFKLKATDELVSMAEELKNVKQLVEEHDYVELFWFPYTDRLWVKKWDKVPIDTPSKNVPGFFRKVIYEWFLSAGGTLGLSMITKTPRWTPFFSKTLVPTTITGTMITDPETVYHYQEKFPRELWDLSYAVPTGDDFEKFESAWNIVIDTLTKFSKPKKSPTATWPWNYKKDGKFPQNFLMHCRFLKTSTGYMAPAVDFKHTVMFEVITYIGTKYHQEFYDEIEAHWKSLGARPHWGKTFNENQDFEEFYGEHWTKFNEIRKQLDPDGLFLNDFMRSVFKVDE